MSAVLGIIDVARVMSTPPMTEYAIILLNDMSRSLGFLSNAIEFTSCKLSLFIAV
jgi:hypothetical protein